MSDIGKKQPKEYSDRFDELRQNRVALSYFIGNSEFWKHKKEQEFTEHMLDKLLSGNNDKTTRFRRYKNLPLQPHHQISHLHLRNNP